ncbi:MAG: exo-beta-N-acetylmuramidase NamZ family protein [Ignavibacteria bacterium]
MLSKFKLGNETLLEYKLDFLKSKKIGLITNQTGILSDGTHLLDALIEKAVKVVKIFSPEHGIRGDESYSNVDEKTGIPIVSLYGEKHKPSPSDLADVDILIYDIQDVGARFYTYTSTLYYAIESATENSIRIIVCDRPVAINPDYVDGFMLETQFASFVGKIPAPVCYGMTCGELANYLSDVIYYSLPYVRPPLPIVEVSKMESYSRSTDFNSLNLKWVRPSPNMFTSSTAVCYPATCFLEGTNVSEGRGTVKPFEYFGAPWCNSQLLAEDLNSFNFEGVVFETINFTPSEKISAYPPKFFNKECSGVYIKVTDKNKFEAVKVGVAILVSLNKLFPEFEFNKNNFIDKLAGTDNLRKMVTGGSDYNTIVSSWEEELKKFKEERKKYLLY